MADIGIAVWQLILSLGKGHCIKTWEMAGKSSAHMKSGGGRSVALTYLPSCQFVSRRLVFLILASKMQPWDNYIKGTPDLLETQKKDEFQFHTDLFLTLNSY